MYRNNLIFHTTPLDAPETHLNILTSVRQTYTQHVTPYQLRGHGIRVPAADLLEVVMVVALLLLFPQLAFFLSSLASYDYPHLTAAGHRPHLRPPCCPLH